MAFFERNKAADKNKRALFWATFAKPEVASLAPPKKKKKNNSNSNSNSHSNEAFGKFHFVRKMNE